MTLPRANRRLTLRTATVLLALVGFGLLLTGGGAYGTAAASEAEAPEAPRDLRVIPGQSGELVVSYRAPSSDGGSAITGYKVQWKSGSEGYDDSSSSTRQTVIADPASFTYTISGLADGTEYTVRVIATNSVGDGPPSREVSAAPHSGTNLEPRGLAPDSEDNSGEGEYYTYHDGNRTIKIKLQPGQSTDEAGDPIGPRSTDDSAELTFQAVSGGATMTLPGGVLVKLNPDWTRQETDAFFKGNGIRPNRVRQLQLLDNTFSVDTPRGSHPCNSPIPRRVSPGWCQRSPTQAPT